MHTFCETPEGKFRGGTKFTSAALFFPFSAPSNKAGTEHYFEPQPPALEKVGLAPLCMQMQEASPGQVRANRFRAHTCVSTVSRCCITGAERTANCASYVDVLRSSGPRSLADARDGEPRRPDHCGTNGKHHL